MRLQGRRVVVTGASSGIGMETARLLASKGASVLAVARSAGPLEALAVRSPGVEPFVADLTVDEDRAALVSAAGEVTCW